MEIKHCVKCHGFCWWDGDFCCTKRKTVIEQAANGEYWVPISETFNANKCEDYDFNKNYHSDPHNYYGQYINFLEEHYELPLIEDKEQLLKELGYKDYKK